MVAARSQHGMCPAFRKKVVAIGISAAKHSHDACFEYSKVRCRRKRKRLLSHLSLHAVSHADPLLIQIQSAQLADRIHKENWQDIMMSWSCILHAIDKAIAQEIAYASKHMPCIVFVYSCFSLGIRLSGVLIFVSFTAFGASPEYLKGQLQVRRVSGWLDDIGHCCLANP